MARTVEDLIIEIADKHTPDKFDNQYTFCKEVLSDFVKELCNDERCYGDLKVNYIDRRNILEKLNKLKSLGEAFNQMTGSLYSGICADEINEILDDLNDNYGVKVNYYQYIPGRVNFTNINKLIEQYGGQGQDN